MPQELMVRRGCSGVLLGTTLVILQFHGGAAVNAAAVETNPVCMRRTPEASVVELLEVMNVFAQARTQTKEMVEQLRRDNPKVPETFWVDFSSRVVSRDVLTSLYAPIYLRHLSQADVCVLASFYRNSPGSHFLHARPAIQEATSAAAQTWAGMIAVELLGSAVAEPPAGKGPRDPQNIPQTQLEDGRVEAIHELLRRSGDLAAAQRTMGATLDRLRQGPQQVALPSSFWDDARKRLLDEEDLLRLWTPAYARQFTDAEIRGLLEFFRSPAGLRYVAALPAIEAEGLDAGGQLGRDVAKRAVREVYGPLPQWRVLHPASPDAAAPDSRHDTNPAVDARQ
jgi:hypothetical protein